MGLELNASKNFFPQRIYKRDDEIPLIKEGVELAETGMYRAFNIVADSIIKEDDLLYWQGEILTAEILRGEIDAAISKSGGTASHTIVAPGTEGADPHNIGFGPIKAHQPLILDIFPRVTHSGYFGDLTRTVVKGKANETTAAAWEAVRIARDQAKGMLTHGVRSADVHNHVCTVLEEHGFESSKTADPPFGFFHGTGHGLGLEIHEAPRISDIGFYTGKRTLRNCRTWPLLSGVGWRPTGRCYCNH